MKLDEFIEKTLIDICKGIQKAKTHEINSNGCIAPVSISSEFSPEKEKVHKIREIEFSVSLKVSDNKDLEVSGDATLTAGFPWLFGRGTLKRDSRNSSAGESYQIVNFSVPYFAEAITIKSSPHN